MGNTLPNYAKALLLQGASVTGTFTEGYYFVEERLQINHAAELHDFCKWIDQHIGGAASGNIDMLFSAFKNPHNAELANKAKVLANRIRAIQNL